MQYDVNQITTPTPSISDSVFATGGDGGKAGLIWGAGWLGSGPGWSPGDGRWRKGGSRLVGEVRS